LIEELPTSYPINSAMCVSPYLCGGKIVRL